MASACPEFSIIIPVWQHGELLEKTLAAVFRQTHEDSEVILAYSEHGVSLPRADAEYGSGRGLEALTLCPCAPDATLADLLKSAALRCRGAYVCFCECGDFWDAMHLDILRQQIRRQMRRVSLLATDVSPQSPDPAVVPLLSLARAILRKNKRLGPLKANINLIPTLSALCVKRELLMKCDFKSPVSCFTSWWLLRQLLKFCRLHYLATVKASWRLPDEYFGSPEAHGRLDADTRKFLIASNLYLIKRFYSKWPGKLLLPFAAHYRTYSNIAHSALFDATYYREKHMPEDERGIPPAIHYALVGCYRGCDPSTRFSTEKYWAWQPVVRAAGMSALAHYERMRISGNRSFCFAPHGAPSFMTPKGLNRGQFEKERNKILLISHELSYTGAPKLLANIAEMLREQGCSVAVLSPIEGELQQELLDKGIPVIIDDSALLSPGGYKPYVEQGYTFCLVNTIVAYRAFEIFSGHLPCAWWIHENVSPEQIHMETRRALTHATEVYVPSPLTKKLLSPFCKCIRILPYPVKDRVGKSFRPKEIRAKVHCAIVGTYSPRKGQDVALQALMGLTAETQGRLTLTMIGQDEQPRTYGRSLRAMAASLPMVKLRGVVSDAEEYHRLYEEADVLLCPSRTDPYPLVVIDALMHGCPVVISDSVGQVDIVEQGENGYIFRSGDVDSLAETLELLVDNQAQLPCMSVAARHTFTRHFEYAACTGKLMEIINKACKHDI